MFQDGSDGVPTESPPTLRIAEPNTRTQTARSRRALQGSPPQSKNGRKGPGRLDAAVVPRPASRPTKRRTITPAAMTAAGHLSRALLTAGEPVVALSPRKVHPPRAAETPGPVRRRIRRPRPPPNGKVEFRGSTLRSHPFTSKRFHVLLNSLFKVLFNFPSRYLSAIGLVSVFSLRWSLPPALGCIPKQPDSKEAPSTVCTSP